jgi:tripartite-type tricarboxylate transporter receptor subunit TctC
MTIFGYCIPAARETFRLPMSRSRLQLRVAPTNSNRAFQARFDRGKTAAFCAFRLAIAVLVLAPSAAFAQAFPSKPIRVIVPFTPAGGTDTAARIMAQAFADDLGWRMVIENRPGASGRIGTELAAKAPADGYTLLMGSVAPNAILPSAAANLPYDAVRDFAPISLLATSDFLLVVHPSLPAKSVRELIALARSKPGAVNFSSVGNASGSHLTGELLKQLARIDIVHVAYKGPPQAVVAVLSGEVSLYFGSGPTVIPHVNAGKLKALATTGAQRSRRFPNLPTVSETVPGHESTQWFGFLAPAGTPKDIIARVHAAIVAAAAKPKVAEQLAAVGSEPVANSPAEFAAFINAEIAKWGKVVKSGVPLE